LNAKESRKFGRQAAASDRYALLLRSFGTSIIGNKLTQEQQAAKLRLVHDVAERVWG
jgi:hypothetical protein